MTIDEVIEKFKFIAKSDTPCPRYCMLPCDKCVDESEHIAEWLEELKTLRLDRCMIHIPERLLLVENGYNKALNDIESEFLMFDKVHYNLQDILCVINKFKAGGTE